MTSDEDLVVELAAGSETALAELLARYEGPIAGYIHRWTGGRDVDDLYQETWWRVVKNAGRFDPSRRFSTWLFQIAVNACRDWYRRTTIRAAEPLNAETVAGRSGEPSARVDADRLLALLPEAQREALVLRYYHDMSEAEIADILDCPRGTVKSRIHNALAKLGKVVDAESTAPPKHETKP